MCHAEVDHTPYVLCLKRTSWPFGDPTMSSNYHVTVAQLKEILKTCGGQPLQRDAGGLAIVDADKHDKDGYVA